MQMPGGGWAFPVFMLSDLCSAVLKTEVYFFPESDKSWLSASV